ncbi:MAG: Thioredoxin [Verrucomicrobia bacterium]|jgi:thioredoxin 1|nr:Thioredoxin [Verrucomicrobiota bacterium]
MGSANIVTLTEANFETEVLKSSTPVLVDFWAEWCGPCKMLGPTLDELSNEYVGKAKIAKLNVDDAQNLAAQYGVSSIPMLLFFKGGQIQNQMVGVKGKAVLKGELDKLV